MKLLELARNKVRELTTQTVLDIYLLNYGDLDYTPLTKDIYYNIMGICRQRGLEFPLFIDEGEVKVKDLSLSVLDSLHYLANSHNIIFSLR